MTAVSINDFILDPEDREKYGSTMFVGHSKGHYRLLIRINGTIQILCRVIANCPKGLVVDHKNRSQFDCRKVNLRNITQKQNSANTSSHKDSKYSNYKGISYDINGRGFKNWQAQILVDGKKIKKRFYTETEAAKQYNEWAMLYHGEYGVLNDV